MRAGAGGVAGQPARQPPARPCCGGPGAGAPGCSRGAAPGVAPDARRALRGSRRRVPPHFVPARGVVVLAQRAEVEQQTTRRLTLSSEDVQADLRFTEGSDKGLQCIVVSAVAEGCELEKAGIRPGQRLLALSDPVRNSEMWKLDKPNVALSRVRDAIRLRRAPTLDLILSAEPVSGAAAPQPQSTASAATGSTGLLDRIAEGQEGNGQGGEGGRPMTIAEKLEQQQAMQESGQSEAAKAAVQLQKRQEKRQQYFEQQGQRNDAPYFIIVTLIVVLPIVVILAIAFSSGYIDRLASNYNRV